MRSGMAARTLALLAAVAATVALATGPAAPAGATRASGNQHASQAAASQQLTLDGNGQGRVFDGVGAASNSSSRLLYDYPEPEKSQVLDYLFKPDYGASLQALKVEIGSDTNSTTMAEPSHERTPGAVDCHRGFEWWLMQQAKARNPRIQFTGLMWSAPSWFKGGLWSQDMVNYIISWLGCAQENGVPVSYIGGADERYTYPPEASFFIALHNALQTTFPNVKIVATDEHTPPNYWAVADTMQNDPAYRDAVDILGEHDVCVWQSRYTQCHSSQAALDLGKPLWNSEQASEGADSGAAPLARAMNRNYIDARVTANMNWSLVPSFYDDTNVGDQGMMLAEWAWSGYYQVTPSIWVDAQTTQFTEPGWRYIDSASGYLSNGGSYVTLRSPTSGDYSVVIETMDATAPEQVTLAPTGGLSQGPAQLWSTDVRSGNPGDWFVHDGTLQPIGGALSLVVQPGHVYTVSTTSGQHKGTAAPPAGTSPSTTLPVPYHEDFEHPEADHMAPYFQDVQGAFEAQPCVGRPGTCYQQVITSEPIPWHRTPLYPTTIVGDPLWWGDYQVSTDAMLEQAGSVELLGRVDKYSQTVESGYHFQVSSSGAWKLYSEDTNGADTTLASGQTSFGTGTWHRLTLVFRGDTVSPELDGQTLATVTSAAHSTGQVGMAVIPWTTAQFDNVSVVPTGPWPSFVPDQDMQATASSEQSQVLAMHNYPPSKAIDGRVGSCWWSQQSPGAPAPLPQDITLRLDGSRVVDGIAYRPVVKEEGVITQYAVSLSSDGTQFHQVASGTWDDTIATKMATWNPQRASFVRLEALKSAGNDGAAACELQVAQTPLK